MHLDKKRDLNLDLIRVVALFAVPLMHSLDNTGVYDRLPLSGLPDLIMVIIRHFFTICIPLYIMLSGYLCINKRLSARYYLGIIRILVIYLIAALAAIAYDQFTGRYIRGLREIVADIINFQCIGYSWYIQMYLGLFLMIPFLNLAYHGLKTRQQKLVLVASAFALSILPSLLNSYVQIYSLWWTRLYPLCYYFTGAYLREYMPKTGWKKLLALLLGCLALFCLYFYIHYDARGQGLTDLYQTSWQIYVLAVITFAMLYRLPLGRLPKLAGKATNEIAELTLPAYLMTWIPDYVLYPILAAHVPAGPERYPWLLVTVPISLISALIMAKLTMILYSPLDKLTQALARRPFFSTKDPLADPEANT